MNAAGGAELCGAFLGGGLYLLEASDLVLSTAVETTFRRTEVGAVRNAHVENKPKKKYHADRQTDDV